MRSANFPQRKERKRKEAAERKLAWAALSIEQQLAELSARPGESKRQRARLLSAK